MADYILDMDKYKALARQVAAESCVLLKNNKNTLPINDKATVSIFGRGAFNYYKSGTGSGGLVNTKYVVGILDALKKEKKICLNKELLDVYEAWIKDHPFDKGKGWGQEPWSQEEMPLTKEIVDKASKSSDLAIVIIARTAGEDQDTKREAGSYYLTKVEEQMLERVCAAFEKVAVVLNVGNIIDMNWVDTYNPPAVLYAWQGGQEGGNGVVDVLCGRLSPSGKLPDTIAKDIDEYPSTKNFGGEKEAIYEEDIYVGYRYFETFAKEKVKYPFGHGISYTTFQLESQNFLEEENHITLNVLVKNIGNYSGKEVVQLYSSAPQGQLGKPVIELKAYKKTKELAPGEEELLSFLIPKSSLASYDDSGITGNKSCYLLEAGEYRIFIGKDVREVALAGAFTIEEIIVVEKLEEALAPVVPFKRLKPIKRDGKFVPSYEPVALRTINPMDKIKRNKPESIEYTGDQGYKLVDVYDKKIEMNTFLAQLSDEDLTCIVRGEGMSSPKVTPGTASAFGGVTKSLEGFGIPIASCADGPSGIRMDCGTEAFSLPNGTAIGSTFNEELVEKLYQMEGMELRKNNIDSLLGPGINIHRNPLNGRNFEYISEDPQLTGTMAKAQVKGLNYAGVVGTMKHFAGNNQEFRRRDLDSIVSERALREIYLKGFEIAVKEGNASSIMTSYGGVNGIWTAGNYDLNTSILRSEWNFEGIVMTDWWAEVNEEGQKPTMQNTGPMIRSQNDLYMVTMDSESNPLKDNSMESIKNGKVTRGEYQRSAANICKMLMKLPVMNRFLGRTPEEDVKVVGQEDDIAKEVKISNYYKITNGTRLDMVAINTDAGHSEVFGITALESGFYDLSAKMRANVDAKELAQMSISVFFDNQLKGTFSITGQDKDWTGHRLDLGFLMNNHYIKLYFSMSGIELNNITFHKTRDRMG